MTEEYQDQLSDMPTVERSFGKLAGALAKAVLSFKPVIKATKNPFFKSTYADLATLIDATRDPLAKNGLVVIQFLGALIENRVTVVTILLHDSGEYLRSEIVMPCGKMDAQGIGSASTYARRYSYGALLNLAGEVDDDCEAAIDRKTHEIKVDLDEKMAKQERISQFQINAIKEACERTKKSAIEQAEYLGKLKLVQWEELTKQDFQDALKFCNSTVKIPAKAAGKPQDHTLEMKRIFATASERGVPEVDVKRWSYETFGVESMTALDKGQLDRVLEFVKQA